VYVLDNLRVFARVRLNRGAMIAGAALVGVTILSLLLFFLIGSTRARRILFFPQDGTGRLVSEQRFLPTRRDLEGDMSELVREEILGAVRNDAQRLVSKDVALRSLFVRGRVAYIDLSADLILSGNEFPLHGADVLKVLRRSICFNFPRVREVVFTVDGQVPNFNDREKIR
jgi:hypothetical protein